MLGHPFTWHVVPVGRAWKVGAPYDGQPSSVHRSQEDAMARAEKLARQHPNGHVLVHDDGEDEPNAGSPSRASKRAC